MNIYSVEPTAGRHLMYLFNIEKIPADISEKERIEIEKILYGKFGIDNVEVIIFTRGHNDKGDTVISCFVKIIDEKYTGSFMLLTLGKKPQVMKICNIYNEGEMFYGRAEWFPCNVLSYYDFYWVQRDFSRVYICPYDEKIWVTVRIYADYSIELGGPWHMSRMEKGEYRCYASIHMNGREHKVSADGFYPGIKAEEVRRKCNALMKAEIMRLLKTTPSGRR